MEKQSRGLNIHEDYRGIEGAESLMEAANEMLKPYNLKLDMEFKEKDETDDNYDECDEQIVTLTQLTNDNG